MNQAQLEQLTEKLWAKLNCHQGRALVIGATPPDCLGYAPTDSPPYEVVIIGSLSAGELLHFSNTTVLDALLRGQAVYLWESGLDYHRHRATASPYLLGKLQVAEAELKRLGIQFYGSKARRPLVTATTAKRLLTEQKPLPPGGILTPLARDILGEATQKTMEVRHVYQ